MYSEFPLVSITYAVTVWFLGKAAEINTPKRAREPEREREREGEKVKEMPFCRIFRRRC